MRNSLSPWRRSNSLWSDFDSLFDTFLTPTTGEQSTALRFTPRVDVIEKDNLYLIKADLPGMQENDIKIEVKDGVLSLKGERKFEEEKEEKGFKRYERAYGWFERHFQLPQKVEADKIQATHVNGVLEILVPKTEVEEARSIPITVGKH